jgi:hypothetical protein
MHTEACSGEVAIRTCDWYTQKHGDGLGTLHEAPGTGEVPRFHSFQCEHLKGVQEAAQTDSIQPDEENVAMVTLHSAESE